MTTRFSEEVKSKVLQLRSTGLAYRVIAKNLQVIPAKENLSKSNKFGN